MKKRVLFLIHDLGPGGAEKVLVNLVNGIDKEQFDVTVKTLFDWGPNRELLDHDVHYSAWIGKDVPANSHWMKLWSPEQLYRKIIGNGYDIAVSFLEGPSARVVGGCPIDDHQTRTVSWIHTPVLNEKKFVEGFRSRSEAERCYGRADAIVFVSKDVQTAFNQFFVSHKRQDLLYNIFESGRIKALAKEEPENVSIDPGQLNWCGMGKLIPLKGWDRMLRIQKRLRDEKIPAHFYVIGDGPMRSELENAASVLGVSDSVTFTGYQMNPYSILSRCMLFVCASEREGFSTAVAESLITGVPVCTVKIGGMTEILGADNEFGVVVNNDDESLYQSVKVFFTDPDYCRNYKERAMQRGSLFDKEKSVKAVEKMLLSL